MSAQYRKYTEEFKREALELLRGSGKSAAQIERDLGITKGLLLKWRERYQVQRVNGAVSLERVMNFEAPYMPAILPKLPYLAGQERYLPHLVDMRVQ